MALVIELPDNKEAVLKTKALAQGVSVEKYAASILDRDLESETPAKSAVMPAQRHISEIIRDRMSEMPADSWDWVPADALDEIDHYVYGVPKRNT